MTESSFIPNLNQIHKFDDYSLIIFKSGSGIFQVDFQNYQFDSGKMIFLAPGQYFRLLFGDLSLALLKFEENEVCNAQNSRFLFNHLVSLGYINLKQNNNDPDNSIPIGDLTGQSTEFLSDTVQFWLDFNPFGTSVNETNLLFDIKDIVDKKYREPVTLDDVSLSLKEKPYRLKSLTRGALNKTIKQLSINKLLLESKRKSVFSDLSTKEMAYDLGFKSPEYFNRFFKKSTDSTPTDFRKAHEYIDRDTFVADLMTLINGHFRDEHKMFFYADQLSMSTKSLSKKLRSKLNTTLHQLIKDKILKEAKKMLQSGYAVKSVAFELGFQESNHFTAFFKKSTGSSPTRYMEDLSKVHT